MGIYQEVAGHVARRRSVEIKLIEEDLHRSPKRLDCLIAIFDASKVRFWIVLCKIKIEQICGAQIIALYVANQRALGAHTVHALNGDFMLNVDHVEHFIMQNYFPSAC